MAESKDGSNARRGDLDRRKFLIASGIAGAAGGFPGVLASAAKPAGPKGGGHRALVIAIEKTASRHDLPNTIPQAKRFITWLVRRAKVEPKNIVFLANAGHPVGAVEGVKPRRADTNSIREAVKEVADGDKIIPDRDRLYFYFTGHGAMLSPDGGNQLYSRLPPQDSIFASDFGIGRPIRVDFVLDWFFETGAREQYLIFDSCRVGVDSLTSVYGDEHPTGFLGTAVEKNAIRQFLFFPVPPGQVTFDIAGDEAFSKVLMNALDNSTGCGKCFDDQGEAARYVVRWEQLKTYLKDHYEKLIQKLDEAQRDQRRDQVPMLLVLPREAVRNCDPILIEYATHEVPTVRLTLDVDPVKARNGATVEINGTGLEKTVKTFEPATSLILDLPPRTYLLDFESNGYITKRNQKIELNEPDSFTCRFVDATSQLPAAIIPGRQSSSVRIRSQDPYAFVRVLNAVGELAVEGMGDVRLNRAVPGEYTLLCSMRNDAIFEKDFRVFENCAQEIDVPAVPPSASAVSDAIIEMLGNERKSLVADAGAYPTPCVKALLAQTLRATEGAKTTPLSEAITANLGLSRVVLATEEAGLRVIMAVETPKGGFAFLGSRLVLEPLNPSGLASEPVSLTASASRVDTVITYSRSVPPGPYTLTSIDGEGHRSVLNLMLLTGRNTELVLYRNEDGWLHMNQFVPRAGSERTAQVVRDLSRLQCDLDSGQMLSTPAILKRLEMRKVDDPIAAAISAWLCFLREDYKGLREVADRMLQENAFAALPDSHVASAIAWEAAGEKGMAIEAYKAALERGLPVLLRFYEAAWNAARLYPDVANAKYAKAADAVAFQRVRSQPWTAWRPNDAPKRR